MVWKSTALLSKFTLIACNETLAWASLNVISCKTRLTMPHSAHYSISMLEGSEITMISEHTHLLLWLSAYNVKHLPGWPLGGCYSTIKSRPLVNATLLVRFTGNRCSALKLPSITKDLEYSYAGSKLTFTLGCRHAGQNRTSSLALALASHNQTHTTWAASAASIAYEASCCRKMLWKAGGPSALERHHEGAIKIYLLIDLTNPWKNEINGE
jgi:hypothetical protein